MNISHELFGLWAVHSGLVLVKTMGMSLWTAKRRVATQTFANPEDTKGPVANNESKVDLANPEVERVRRCHLVSYIYLVEPVCLHIFMSLFTILRR